MVEENHEESQVMETEKKLMELKAKEEDEKDLK